METIIKDQHEKEIIIKGVRQEDHPKVGPKIGIIDISGIWYNSLKNQWTKIPGAWEAMTGLVAGDRVKITYTVRGYKAKDGTPRTTNDIIGFEKIIRREDEVIPPTFQLSLPRETPSLTKPITRDDLIAKESAFKSAAEFLKAVGPEVINSLAIIMVDVGNPGTDEYFKIWTDIAHACYADMVKNW